MIITVANQKGGVAKTTTAVSVAHGLAIRTGQPTLLLDLDQQGHDATALGMMAESCLFDFLVADAPLANCVRQTGRENLLLLPGNARTKHVDLTIATKSAASQSCASACAACPTSTSSSTRPPKGCCRRQPSTSPTGLTSRPAVKP